MDLIRFNYASYSQTKRPKPCLYPEGFLRLELVTNGKARIAKGGICVSCGWLKKYHRHLPQWAIEPNDRDRNPLDWTNAKISKMQAHPASLIGVIRGDYDGPQGGGLADLEGHHVDT